jgi:hypothetical protein
MTRPTLNKATEPDAPYLDSEMWASRNRATVFAAKLQIIHAQNQ